MGAREAGPSRPPLATASFLLRKPFIPIFFGSTTGLFAIYSCTCLSESNYAALHADADTGMKAYSLHMRQHAGTTTALTAWAGVVSTLSGNDYFKYRRLPLQELSQFFLRPPPPLRSGSLLTLVAACGASHAYTGGTVFLRPSLPLKR